MSSDVATPITATTRVRPSGRVYARPFGEEVVLLDFGLGEYFGLDAIGAEVWRGLEAGRTLQEIAEGIVGSYDVAPDRALADIMALVGELASNALIVVDAEPAGQAG